MARTRKARELSPWEKAFVDGWQVVWQQPIFSTMRDYHTGPTLSAEWAEDDELRLAKGWARVDANGHIAVNKHARLSTEEWTWVLAHCALHLGFGHVDAEAGMDLADRVAACVSVARFQQQLRLGKAPMEVPAQLPGGLEQSLAEVWRRTGIPAGLSTLGCAGTGADFRWAQPDDCQPLGKRLSWPDRLAVGLANAAARAVDEAGEIRAKRTDDLDPNNPWERARRWFVSAFPLLGALAAGFKIVASVELARAMDIWIAAVDAERAEIYVNPLFPLPEEQCRFVVAHEMLHAALRHGERVGHRDPFFWNVAADYVINGWLVEMAVGEMPEDCLYDPAMKGRSAEDVYDEITKNLRRARKLATLRGRGMGDMVSAPTPARQRGGDLDDFYRRALASGLAYCEQMGRGTVPAGLVAEIRVLDQPPLPWDVKLAQWFDRHFTPLDRSRSFARPSRRQASTPDIPRPGWHRPEIPTRERTFGVVLDTSGSMNHELMGKALGAIASYARARDVPAARVVFCDAVAYDAGYLEVDDIAGRVKVRGRGGTVLQPGIDLLQRAEDFPKDGPILLITDAECDVLKIRREHAFLVPRGKRLPFDPKGEVFWVR